MLKRINYYLYRFKYINAVKLNLKKPVDVSLELSSFCTNTCGYCYHANPKDLPFARGKMSKGLAFKILEDAASIGVNSIKFNYRGEATMNPHFFDITKKAKDLAHGSTFIDRILNTNFNFKNDREDIFQGLCNQTKVKISFDSFKKNVFEKQRRGSKYDSTIDNMNKFYNYPGRKTIMVVQSVRTLKNKDEDLAHEIKSRWPEAIVSIRDVVEGRVKADLSDVVVKKRDHENRQSCIQAHARLMINFDGKAQVCCPDISSKLIIGDVSEESILSIWNNQKAKRIREDLKSKSAFLNDPCKTCSSFESYNGYKAQKDS